MTTNEEIGGWRAGLDDLHARIAPRFRRSEARERAKRYLVGLLDRVERKNGWQLAEHLGESGPQGMQRLLNAADWDADAVRGDLCAYVTEHLGDADGVLIIDETGFLKKGTKSVGVQRQYSGTAGRRENCQIGVFLGYASDRGRTFLDRELYLPKEWADDAERRREAGVPDDVAFATKPALARRMLERAFAGAVPAAWVAGDEIDGNDAALRRWLEGEHHPYVLAASCNHAVWHDGRQERADALIAALPATAWGTLSCGAGAQGERLYVLVLSPPPLRVRDRDGALAARPAQPERSNRVGVLPRFRASDHGARGVGTGGRDALGDRGEFRGCERGSWAGPLRGAQVGRLVSPHHPRPLGPRLPRGDTPQCQSSRG